MSPLASHRSSAVVIAILALGSSVVLAETTREVGRLTVVASPLAAATALRVDGDLNDEVWQRATPTSGFRQRDPQEGADPAFQTEFRVAYDGEAIYVAVEAFDEEPERIVGLLTRRDSESPSDWLHVYIDSYRDRRSAYEFAVNPVGVKRDTYWYGDGQQDRSWDAVWDVAVATTQRGWRAEFRIPFSQLRFRAGGDGTLGFAVARQVARLNEMSTWPLVARSVTGWVSQFGDLTGVELTQPPKRLELVPYAVGQIGTHPDSDPDRTAFITAEATLSFLGAGLVEPTASWGRTIADAQNSYARYPLWLWPPVIGISLLVLAMTLLGDSIRDAFDPNTRR